MKKRILSILLTLCMVLSLITVAAFAETPSQRCSLTLNFKYGTLRGQTGSYLVGSAFKIADNYDINSLLREITGCEPYEVCGVWSATGDGATGTFTDHDIVLEVVYKVQGSLAITVDGFEVGKTPADTTLSFASTIPGVTFDEENFLHLYWEKYVFDGTGDSWAEVKKTEVFQADTTYRILISLNNDVLVLPPAVTVNGKTPESCEIRDHRGVPYALVIFCEFGTPPMPPLTIDGPDVVCAEQDYEFTVTPPAGVTLDKEFGYDTGMKGGGADLTVDADGVGHGVVSVEWYDLQTNRFTLTAHGKTAGGTPVTGSKTVEVSPEHIYVDGVCSCGAVQQYTVEYIGSGDDPICMDTKTHGEPLTLRGETFTMDGFVQTGWVDGQGAVYELGAAYTEDRDVTLYPVFEKIVTVTVPFTTTVALGDAGEPGETTFDLAIVGANTGEENYADVSVSGSVTTNGAGDYDGTLTITGPERQLWYMLSEGAFVQQVNAGEENWTYDDTVYGLLLTQIAAYSADDAVSPYTVLILPAISVETDEGVYYDLNWEAIDWENDLLDEMRFENVYTAHGHEYELKHDESSHWDECDCGDVQNKEAHKYGDWTVTKEATEQEAGEKEHTCTVCGYTEKAEIAKLTGGDTPKPDPDVPQTGDNSHMALWIALLFVSGAGVIGTTVYGKKKRVK